jgi:hypothetical protein
MQALLVGLVLGLVMALGKAFVRRHVSSPEGMQQWLALKGAWALKRRT